ncbi:MAG: PHP-associated domain-containing protein [Fervidobacterium sp.]
MIVPGIEIHTVEDVHILGYFSSLENCLKVSEIIKQNLTPFTYDPETFGYQIVINENEEFISTVENYLGFPTNLTIKDTIDIILENNGLPVFAHVDRKFGAIYQLGLLPEGSRYIEVKKKSTYEELKNEGFIILTSSDAHLPDEVGIRKIFFEERPKSAKEVLELIIEGRFKTIWD